MVGLLPTMGAVMADQHADVVIVGGGIVGSSAAYYLAGRGARVVVLERGDAPGEQSRKNWGFVRQQGRDPAEVPLMMEANRIWRGLEAELGADIEWVQGGNLALAANGERMALFEDWLRVAKQFGLDTRLLRPDDLPSVVPGLVPGWVGGLYTPSDGHADPGKATDAFARAAGARGAVIRLSVAARGVTTQGGRASGVLSRTARAWRRSERHGWSARRAPGRGASRARSASRCRSGGCAARWRGRRRRPP